MTAGSPDPDVRVGAAGDSALRLEFAQRIDPAINGRAIAIAGYLQERCGAAVRDAVVGYATLTVYFDPLVVDPGWMEAEMLEAAARLRDVVESGGPPVEVPVCYEGDLGPDLETVAGFGGCTTDEVIALHVAGEYRVYMMGFVPGFTYMAAVDPRIAAPRRAAPRAAVPAGSVAIAGEQTGIYPMVTPGGWNIIGRTPARPYDPSRPSPFLFKPGDRVRFQPISRDLYDRMS